MEAAKWVICIRGLKWTKRGREEGRERGEQGIKKDGREREEGLGRRRGGSPGTGFVMLNPITLPSLWMTQ